MEQNTLMKNEDAKNTGKNSLQTTDQAIRLFCDTVKITSHDEALTLKKSGKATMIGKLKSPEAMERFDKFNTFNIRSFGLECSPETINVFSRIVLEDYPDLSLEDMVFFYKIIQRQRDKRYKILGNKLTLLHLTEFMDTFYDDLIGARELRQKRSKEVREDESKHNTFLKRV